MKALTLTQPWCGLVASGIKRIENRPWNPPRAMIGQRFALHASREVDAAVFPRLHELAPELCPADPSEIDDDWRERNRSWFITSAIIGVATLERFIRTTNQLAFGADGIDTIPVDQRRWFFGPVGFVLTDIHMLYRPLECAGALSFWNVPDQISEALKTAEMVPRTGVAC